MKVCPSCRTLYLNNEPFCPKDGEKTVAPEQNPEKGDLIGTSVGNYQITSLLGEGGMGRVYRAEHPTLGRVVAIKVLHTEYARRIESVERFFNEAKAVNKIGHDNIIDVLDFGQLPDGSPYYVMEFLDGCTLTEYINQYPQLPLHSVCEVMIPILVALHAAHEEGIVHRDLKPDNIFIAEKKRGAKIIKLLDFGVAKLLDTKATSYKTRTGAIIGTPFYMSPEQVSGGDQEIDARADVYAAGLIFYEMLTGKAPFIGNTILDIFQKRLTEDAAPPHKLRPEIPRELSDLVMKAIARHREDRLQTTEEFAQQLEEIAQRSGFSLSKSLLNSGSAPVIPTLPTPAETQLNHDLARLRGETTLTPDPNDFLVLDPKRTTLTRSTGELSVAPPANNKKVFYWAGAALAASLLFIVLLSSETPKTSPAKKLPPPPAATLPQPEPASVPASAPVEEPVEAPPGPELIEPPSKPEHPSKPEPKKSKGPIKSDLKKKLDKLTK